MMSKFTLLTSLASWWGSAGVSLDWADVSNARPIIPLLLDGVDRSLS